MHKLHNHRPPPQYQREAIHRSNCSHSRHSKSERRSWQIRSPRCIPTCFHQSLNVLQNMMTTLTYLLLACPPPSPPHHQWSCRGTGGTHGVATYRVVARDLSVGGRHDGQRVLQLLLVDLGQRAGRVAPHVRQTLRHTAGAES